MLDSINFTIQGIEWIDFNHLKKLGIYARKFKKRKKNFTNIGYEFRYKKIKFQYSKSFKTITIIAHAHKILKKRDIHISDLQEYKRRLREIVKTVLNNDNLKLDLSRIDYYTDLKLDDKVIPYINLLKCNKRKYKYMKIEKDYPTSIYMKTKVGQNNLNIYSRYEKTKKEEDKGILRIEVQNKKKKIKNEYDKYGIDKDLDNYWNIQAMNEYYFNFLYDYLYEGNYYKRKTARQIINNSSYTISMKDKLKKFLKDIEKSKLYTLIAGRKYSNGAINNYIEKLNHLSINPIPIPEDSEYDKLDNLLNLAREKAKTTYFL